MAPSSAKVASPDLLLPIRSWSTTMRKQRSRSSVSDYKILAEEQARRKRFFAAGRLHRGTHEHFARHLNSLDPRSPKQRTASDQNVGSSSSSTSSRDATKQTKTKSAKKASASSRPSATSASSSRQQPKVQAFSIAAAYAEPSDQSSSGLKATAQAQAPPTTAAVPVVTAVFTLKGAGKAYATLDPASTLPNVLTIAEFQSIAAQTAVALESVVPAVQAISKAPSAKIQSSTSAIETALVLTVPLAAQTALAGLTLSPATTVVVGQSALTNPTLAVASDSLGDLVSGSVRGSSAGLAQTTSKSASLTLHTNSAMTSLSTNGNSGAIFSGNSGAQAVATPTNAASDSASLATSATASKTSAVTNPSWPAANQDASTGTSTSRPTVWPIIFPIIAALGLLLFFYLRHRRKRRDREAGGPPSDSAQGTLARLAHLRDAFMALFTKPHNSVNAHQRSERHLEAGGSATDLSEKDYWEADEPNEKYADFFEPVGVTNDYHNSRRSFDEGAELSAVPVNRRVSFDLRPMTRNEVEAGGTPLTNIDLQESQSANSHSSMPATKSQAILQKIGAFWTRPPSIVENSTQDNRLSADTLGSDFVELERNRRTSNTFSTTSKTIKMSTPMINVYNASPVSHYSLQNLEASEDQAFPRSPSIFSLVDTFPQPLVRTQKQPIPYALFDTPPAGSQGLTAGRRPLPPAVARLRALSPIPKARQQEAQDRRPSVDSGSHASHSDMNHSVASESFSLFSGIGQMGLTAAPAPPRRPSRELPIPPGAKSVSIAPNKDLDRHTYLEDLSRQIAPSPVPAPGLRYCSAPVQPLMSLDSTTQGTVPHQARATSFAAAHEGRADYAQPLSNGNRGMKNFHLNRIAGSLAMRRNSSVMSCESFGNLNARDFAGRPSISAPAIDHLRMQDPSSAAMPMGSSIHSS